MKKLKKSQTIYINKEGNTQKNGEVKRNTMSKNQIIHTQSIENIIKFKIKREIKKISSINKETSAAARFSFGKRPSDIGAFNIKDNELNKSVSAKSIKSLRSSKISGEVVKNIFEPEAFAEKDKNSELVLESNYHYLKTDNNVLVPSLRQRKKEKFRKIEKRSKVFDSLSGDGNQFEYTINCYIILPNSVIKQYWDLMINLLIIYSIFYYPIRIAFDSSENNGFSNFNTFLDFTFLTDCFMSFFVSYYDEETETFENSLTAIMLSYLTGWFSLDLMSSIPFDLIVKLSQRNSISNLSSLANYSKILKWLRVIRILKLTKKKNEKDILIYQAISKINDSLMRILKFAFFLILLSHLVCCFYIYIAKSEGNYNWVQMNNLNSLNDTGLYVSGLYFTFATIITVGYGDIIPFTNIERLYVSLLLTIGSGVFSFALSAVSSFFLTSSDISPEVIKKEETLLQINQEYKLSPHLFQQLRNTFSDNIKNYISGLDKFLAEFPPLTKNLLYTSMYRKHIRVLSFFRNRSNDFITFVIPLMHFTQGKRNTSFFDIGEYIEEMYLVFKGKLSLRLGRNYENFEISVIKKGIHFGDILMYTHDQSNFSLSIKSKTAQILIIRKSDFARIKLEFAEEINEVLKGSFKSYKLIEERRLIAINHHKLNKNFAKFQFPAENKNVLISPDYNKALRKTSFIEKIENRLNQDNMIKKILTEIESEDIVFANKNKKSQKSKRVLHEETLKDLKELDDKPPSPKIKLIQFNQHQNSHKFSESSTKTELNSHIQNLRDKNKILIPKQQEIQLKNYSTSPFGKRKKMHDSPFIEKYRTGSNDVVKWRRTNQSILPSMKSDLSYLNLNLNNEERDKFFLNTLNENIAIQGFLNHNQVYMANLVKGYIDKNKQKNYYLKKKVISRLDKILKRLKQLYK